MFLIFMEKHYCQQNRGCFFIIHLTTNVNEYSFLPTFIIFWNYNIITNNQCEHNLLIDNTILSTFDKSDPSNFITHLFNFINKSFKFSTTAHNNLYSVVQKTDIINKKIIIAIPGFYFFLLTHSNLKINFLLYIHLHY